MGKSGWTKSTKGKLQSGLELFTLQMLFTRTNRIHKMHREVSHALLKFVSNSLSLNLTKILKNKRNRHSTFFFYQVLNERCTHYLCKQTCTHAEFEVCFTLIFESPFDN